MKKLMIVGMSLVFVGLTAFVVSAKEESHSPLLLSSELAVNQNQGHNQNENQENISKEEALKIAESFVDGKVKDVDLERNRERYYYEIEMELNGHEVDIDIDAKTGELIKIDGDLSETFMGESEEFASVQKAMDEIKQLFPDSIVDEMELKKEKDGNFYYEIEIENFGEDGEIYLNAQTLEVLYIDSDIKPFLKGEQTVAYEIDQQKAIELAIEHVGEGVVEDIEITFKKGKVVYEIEIEAGAKEVDIYIDVNNGDVVHEDWD
ncbi:hypothetical protein BTS2_2642 [Bacillus sp. TS-2]|nr:hypothetical protein BTS2_2642 [Bacillus sp. TS-2]